MLTEFHIGIDDTDSRSEGCTTYTAAVLFQELCNREIYPYDYPWLVRLNPNIPWKTRGNGALSIHLVVDEAKLGTIRNLAIRLTEETADLTGLGTDPAVAFLKGPVPELLRQFSTSALHEVLSVHHARKIAMKVGAETHLLKGTRGLIGSMAAIGAGLDSASHTFEIIAYRTRDNLGTPRRVDLESVRIMSLRHQPGTFHNLDYESGRILLCPHGADPVLLGIRGLSPRAVHEAYEDVRIDEPVERTMIFRTNQGTDAHLTQMRHMSELTAYQSVILEGRIETIPKVLRGGHVIFRVSDDSAVVDCAVFAPTRSLTAVARELLPGDRVRLYGGVRKHRTGSLTLNLEKIAILQLIDDLIIQNPLCTCGSRCESMGREQGFRCRRCGLRYENAAMVISSKKRNLQPITYKATIGARRHLSSP